MLNILNNKNFIIFIIGIIFLFVIILSIRLEFNLGFYIFLFVTSCFFASYIIFSSGSNKGIKILSGIIFAILFGILYMIFFDIVLIFYFVLAGLYISNGTSRLGWLLLSIFLMTFLSLLGNDLLFLIGLGSIIFLGNYLLWKFNTNNKESYYWDSYDLLLGDGGGRGGDGDLDGGGD